jgi:3-oxoacyl-[acyl-carrier protein] reductase
MGVLDNRVAVITGSGSGLGKAAALHFAKEGASVVVCGRTKSKIEVVRNMIEDAGGSAIAVSADVSSEEQVNRVVSETLKHFGRLDILINNAAVFHPGLVIDTSLGAWNEQLLNNLTSAFLMTRTCLPIMIKQNYGRIINITSSLAENGAGGFAAYSASKAGLESLTRTTADEQIGYDILANMFDPGTVKSGMHATGKDPLTVVPEIARLASLNKHEINGKLVITGQQLSS